jgi:hypothetical protein
VIVRNDERRTMVISTAWQQKIVLFGGLCGEQCKRTYVWKLKGEGSY